MLKKIAFTMYPVHDIERAKNFYEKNLGLAPSKFQQMVPGLNTICQVVDVLLSRH